MRFFFLLFLRKINNNGKKNQKVGGEKLLP